VHALRVLVAGVALFGAGVVSCAGEPAPWLRNQSDVNPCERVPCGTGSHCEWGAGDGPGHCEPDRPSQYR